MTTYQPKGYYDHWKTIPTPDTHLYSSGNPLAKFFKVKYPNETPASLGALPNPSRGSSSILPGPLNPALFKPPKREITHKDIGNCPYPDPGPGRRESSYITNEAYNRIKDVAVLKPGYGAFRDGMAYKEMTSKGLYHTDQFHKLTYRDRFQYIRPNKKGHLSKPLRPNPPTQPIPNPDRQYTPFTGPLGKFERKKKYETVEHFRPPERDTGLTQAQPIITSIVLRKTRREGNPTGSTHQPYMGVASATTDAPTRREVNLKLKARRSPISEARIPETGSPSQGVGGGSVKSADNLLADRKTKRILANTPIIGRLDGNSQMLPAASHGCDYSSIEEKFTQRTMMSGSNPFIGTPGTQTLSMPHSTAYLRGDVGGKRKVFSEPSFPSIPENNAQNMPLPNYAGMMQTTQENTLKKEIITETKGSIGNLHTNMGLPTNEYDAFERFQNKKENYVGLTAYCDSKNEGVPIAFTKSATVEESTSKRNDTSFVYKPLDIGTRAQEMPAPVSQMENRTTNTQRMEEPHVPSQGGSSFQYVAYSGSGLREPAKEELHAPFRASAPGQTVGLDAPGFNTKTETRVNESDKGIGGTTDYVAPAYQPTGGTYQSFDYATLIRNADKKLEVSGRANPGMFMNPGEGVDTSEERTANFILTPQTAKERTLKEDVTINRQTYPDGPAYVYKAGISHPSTHPVQTREVVSTQIVQEPCPQLQTPIRSNTLSQPLP